MQYKIFSDLSLKSKAKVYPALVDSYSFILSQLFQHNNKIMFVVDDEAKLQIIADQIKFFSSDINVIVFPAWDCAPYEKVSPNISSLSKRINVLDQLCNLEDKNTILLLSIDSVIQKLPPVDLIPSLAKTIKINDVIKRDEFLMQLIELSFRRVEVASEPGDFAVRGDIIDIISPPEEGWRIDFFGSKIDRIRSYDPITQISKKELNEIHVLPSSEVVLSQEAVERFKVKFIEEFGELSIEHPLYEAIKDKRKYAGMEHYLPCFYKKLSNIFDYFNPDLVICDNDFMHELGINYKQIKDYYEDRQELLSNRFQDELIYYPLNPSLMWLNLDEIEEYLKKYKIINLHNFTLDDTNGFDLDIVQANNFDLASQNKGISSFDLFKSYRDSCKQKIIIACYSEGSLERINGILENYNIHSYRLSCFNDYKNISGKTVGIAILPIEHGYSFEDFSIIAEQDLLGKKIIRKKSKKSLENLLEEINNLQIGEHVVHQKHGVGLFSGLETILAAGIHHDCIKLIYAGNDVLYIPVENLDLLSRYGSSEDNIKLDKLGGSSWKQRKAKLKEKLKDIAADLIKTAALRASKHGEYLGVSQGSYEEFCARFRYVETDDQLNSIKDVEEDLVSGMPMDRLICGDVGFGKTEVAMRAAFIATHPDKNVKQQVVIIVPTTLLARQHYHSFFKRFAGFNVVIKQLSRLVSAKEIKEVKAGLKDGSVDIVIGTHAVLAKDIEFNNLGLLIVDEEQRFGVIQKEKLKKFQENIHILTLSATPIPRTLQMSLTGVKDLSIIATPPVDRIAVKTYTMHYDSVVIREAILREFYRGGQIFFVCPRISDISELLPKLTELVPEIKIVVAHGQMSPGALEEIMNDFYNKKFNMLLSTSIVESGIDIAQANTIFIHRADKFGLSALYQLRGRVGRSNIKAFSYLLLPNKKLAKHAMARLEVMQTLDTLGAGFTVASHDMDIRGFGNLVGDSQSGHIKEVGLELYQQMLNEAIMSIKSKDKLEEDIIEVDDDYSPQINIGVPVMIPESYVEDLGLRLSLYRHLAGLKTADEVDSYAAEMMDRFGNRPIEVEFLCDVLKLKLKAKLVNVDKVDAGVKAITFAFRDNKCLKPEETLDFIEKNQAYLKVRSDHKLLINKEFKTPQERVKFISELLTKLKFEEKTKNETK
jgi:transcription-repair coupling factor (superfamily II helicase)